MSKIWFLIVIVSMITLLFTSPENILVYMGIASTKTINLCITLSATYIIWLGFMQIMDDCGLNKKLTKVLSPIIKKIFGPVNEKSANLIAMNLSSNIIGLGGVATPAGIQAMVELEKQQAIAKKAMIMLLVINSTSLQLLPTTPMSLRSAAGSISAGDIIIPSIISTLISSIIGIITTSLILNKKKKKNNG